MNKQQRREAMPFVTSCVDDMRKAFGEPAGIHAEENGHRINWGEPMPEGYEVSPVVELKRGTK